MIRVESGSGAPASAMDDMMDIEEALNTAAESGATAADVVAPQVQPHVLIRIPSHGRSPTDVFLEPRSS